MTSRKPSFTSQGKFVSEPPRPLYKGSLMGDLLPFKRNVFEKFPAKSLILCTPATKLGEQGTYEFTVGEKHDKAVFRGLSKGSVDFVARHRKKDGEYDVTLTQKMCCNSNVFIKVEERTGSRDVVVGGNYKSKDLKINMKTHPLLIKEKANKVDTKASAMYTLPFHSNLSMAFDLAANISNLTLLKYTVGSAYTFKIPKFPVVAGVSYNHDNLLTVSAGCKLVDYKTDLGAEMVYNPNPIMDLSKYTWMVGAAYNMDKDLALKAKINSSWQGALSVKKTLSPNVTVAAGTLFNLSKPDRVFSNVGFKVMMKA